MICDKISQDQLMNEILKSKFYNLGTEKKPVLVPKPAIDDPSSKLGDRYWEGIANGGNSLPDEKLDQALKLATKNTDARP